VAEKTTKEIPPLIKEELIAASSNGEVERHLFSAGRTKDGKILVWMKGGKSGEYQGHLEHSIAVRFAELILSAVADAKKTDENV
jgi:hypothetical protein